MSKTLVLIGVACILIAIFLSVKMTQTPSSIPQTISTNGNLSTAPVMIEADTWRDFTAPSGKFKVSMPSLPQQAAQRIEDPKTKGPRNYDMYLSEDNQGSLYLISIITMLDNPNAKIDDAVMTTVINDLLAKNPDSKVKKMEAVKFKDFPAMDFSIESNQVNIDGRAFLAGNTLYVLTYAAQPNNYNEKNFKTFTNSFQFTPEIPTKEG